MKVLTLNLNTYQEDNQYAKFKMIAQLVVDEKIDIICLCEAAQNCINKPIDNYVREGNAAYIICKYINELSNSKDYKFVWDISHYGFKVFEEGLAIISRYPMTDVKSQYVSNTHDVFTYKSRKCIKATIDYKGEKINVYSCQLGQVDDKQEPFNEQMIKLHEWISEDKSGNWSIIAGDFGNDVNTAAYKQIISLGYIDQYVLDKNNDKEDETFIFFEGCEELFERLRLDYIFTNQQKYPVVCSKRVFDKANRVSDHMGVVIEWNL